MTLAYRVSNFDLIFALAYEMSVLSTIFRLFSRNNINVCYNVNNTDIYLYNININ